MDIKQSFFTAIRNLGANKIRFFQATLGMVIGIAGFVYALSCGFISALAIQFDGDTYDPALLCTSIFTRIDSPVRITPKDILHLADDNPEVIKGISPYVEFEFPGGVRYGERTGDNAQLYGVGPSYLAMLPVLHLQEGRFLTDLDVERERKVCVIGSSIANDLIGGEALGKEIKVWGENYTVIGVFEEVPNEPYPRRNIEVYIPYTNAFKILGDDALKAIGDPTTSATCYTYSYYVCANGKENMYDAQVLIKETLTELTGREKDNGWNMQCYGMGGTVDKIKGYVIGAAVQEAMLASIVLIIGGAGIMNVMLASVQARTKEIGIRKAFGATANDIKRQFMLEAVITGLIGGLLGVAVGFGIILGIFLTSHSPLTYITGTVWPMLAAFAITILVGVLSGTYPAKQAAKLEPVAAINES